MSKSSIYCCAELRIALKTRKSKTTDATEALMALGELEEGIGLRSVSSSSGTL